MPTKDTIYAQLFNSNGVPILTWNSIVFHSSYVFNGQTLQNCWVAPGVQPLCGSNAIDVIWYYQSQCNDGDFSQQFYLNHAPIASSPFPFTVFPQIEESRVPNFSQVRTTDNKLEADDPAYAYDSVCRYLDASGSVISGSDHECKSLPNEVPVYIKALGCYLSDAANILTYHGITADPPTLNTGLNNTDDGYLPVGNVNPDGLVSYAGGQNN